MTKVNTNILKNNAIVYSIAVKSKIGKVTKRVSSRKGCMTRPWKRRSVGQVFNELGRIMFRRAYRMHIETFHALYLKIKVRLFLAISYDEERQFAPNGRVHPTVRLACALRVFSGGDPMDIASCVYGVSRTVVYDSVKYVRRAANTCRQMAIVFPGDHAKQLEIAEGFRKKSRANTPLC